MDSCRGGGLSHRESLEVSSCVRRGQGSQIQDQAVWLCYFISVFWFVSCPEIYPWKKIYLVNWLFQQVAENR